MRNRCKIISRYCTSLAIGVIAVSAPAMAQDGGAEAGAQQNQGDVIIVTAQFREQNLQDTPIAITAVSSEMMEARSQTNIQQIAGQAPGVNLQQNNATFGPSMAASIRGVGQYDPSPAVEPGVGFYVDDVYYPSLTGALFDLLDLERVEVLRGPQGTLSGRNSVGGAIKLFSKRPTGDNSGRIQATYGAGDRVELRGSFDFGLGDDLAMRISGASKRQDGYVGVYDFGCVNPQGSANNPVQGGIPATRPAGDCLVDKHGDVNYQAIRGQLRYNPGNAVDIMISADYVNDSHAPAPNVLRSADFSGTGAALGPFENVRYDSRFICGPYCNYSTGIMPADPANGIAFETTRPQRTEYEGMGLSAQAEIELTPDLQITSITGYRKFTTEFAGDLDLSPLPINAAWTRMEVEFFSQELRLNGALADDAVQYAAGMYYSNTDTTYATVQDIRSVNLQFAALADEVPAESLAFFGHASWEVAYGLTLNGGIRRTHEKKDYLFSRVFADGSPGHPIVGAIDGETGRYRETRWDYRANVQYQWTPDVMTYAQFSTGYKGGGINPRPYFPDQVQDFSAEALQAFELGLKSDLFDRRVRLNLSGFYNKFNDIQLVLTSCPEFTPGGAPAPCSMTANAGDADVKGFEAETTIRPLDGLLIDASLSYVDFQYKNIAEAAGGPTGVRLTDVPPFMSDWKWSVGAQYEAFLPQGYGSLTPRVDVAYQSGFYSSGRNDATSYVPSHTIANARLTWKNDDEDLSISLEVTNLFDEYYLQNVFDQTLTQGSVAAQPARPREWAVSVSKRF